MNDTERQYPSPKYAWYMVGILTVAYILSFVVDRYVLGLLIEPIKEDLGLTDTQIGLLLGPAFAIFYATMGLPLGYLADRKRRTWIVAAGIFVWSAATAASALLATSATSATTAFFCSILSAIAYLLEFSTRSPGQITQFQW